MTLMEAAEAAVRHVRRWPRDATVRLVTDQDADGVAAAAVAVKWLQRAGRKFHVTYTWRRDRAFYETVAENPEDPLVVLDRGADQLPMLADVARHGLVVDHHPVPAAPGAGATGGWRQLNPWLADLDGARDASAATTTLALAVAESDENWDQAPAALVGAVGDRQWRPDGFTGFNAEAATEAESRDLLGRRAFPDVDDLPLTDLFRWPTGHLARILGTADARQWLHALSLPDEASPMELTPDDLQRLASTLTHRWLARGADAADVKSLLTWHPTSTRHDDAPLARLAALVEATARGDDPGTGLALLLGDPDARRDAESMEASLRRSLRGELERLAGEVEVRDAFRVLATDQTALIGLVASIGLGRVVPDDRPLVVHAPGDGAHAVSARATPRLVEDGVDLGRALSHAAGAAGGTGGGHAGASGANVPVDRIDEFLDALGHALPTVAATQEEAA